MSTISKFNILDHNDIYLLLFGKGQCQILMIHVLCQFETFQMLLVIKIHKNSNLVLMSKFIFGWVKGKMVNDTNLQVI